MSQDNPLLSYYTIRLQGEEIDPERLDRLTRQLRSELLDLEVESVDFVQGDQLPEGVKGADAITLGALAVAVLPTFLPKLVEYLQSWTLRGEGRRVKIKSQVGDRSIELEYMPQAMSQQELKTLVETLTHALEEKQAGE
ncbi:MAG TPA: hypothetical protein VE136_05085 [Anaerolineales bacterium]|jgi:hypothetical protein|nr:hypothetical protein [Anaerolineales bacterium]